VNASALMDTAPLVALLDRRERHHAWVLDQMSRLRPPTRTCEPVIAEAFHLLRHLPKARTAILEMLTEGVLTVPFHLQEHGDTVHSLINRYSNIPMSLADACLVRMSELIDDSVIVTLDSDFTIYRRHKRQKIPRLMPPDR
jgi:predicted nucleic acid-binding protein